MIFNFLILCVLLPSPSYQAAGRFLIFSYFYGFLILRSEQVAGTYGVACWQVADSRRAYGCAWVCAPMCLCICTCVCMCMTMYRLAANNQEGAAD